SVLFTILGGAAAGWAAEWVAAYVWLGTTGAGYTGTTPQWDAEYATFSALHHGVPFGVIMALVAYIVFFRRATSGQIARVYPVLLLAVLIGALVGIPLGLGRLVTASAFLFGACHLVTRRQLGTST